MTIYEALPKVELPGGLHVTAYIDAPIEYIAESVAFNTLTAACEVPLTEIDYIALLDAAPFGWREAFGKLRAAGVI